MTAEHFNYQIVENWALGPRGRAMAGVVPGVAADARGRVFIARREPPALLVYDRDGAYLDTWGDELLPTRTCSGSTPRTRYTSPIPIATPSAASTRRGP